MNLVRRLTHEMTGCYAGDPGNSRRFIKAYSFSKLIGECEETEGRTQTI